MAEEEPADVPLLAVALFCQGQGLLGGLGLCDTVLSGQDAHLAAVAGAGGLVHFFIESRRVFQQGLLHRAGCLQQGGEIGGGQGPKAGEDPLYGLGKARLSVLSQGTA